MKMVENVRNDLNEFESNRALNEDTNMKRY